MEKSISDSNIDWEEVITVLTAFTRSLIKHQSWYRQGFSSFKGKEVRDYVFEAIKRHLLHPEKYDPSKGCLNDYLKYNLIRSLVSNDVTSKENRVNRDVFKYSTEDNQDDDGAPYLDRILPCIEPLFSDDIDYQNVKEFMEKEINGDKIVEEIFLGLYCMGIKRREIIEEFGMTSRDYDNGNRRLETIIKKASSHFNANKQTV